MSLMLLIKCLVSFGWRFLYTPLRAPRVLGQSVSPTTTRRIEEEKKKKKEGRGGGGREEKERKEEIFEIIISIIH